MIIDGILLHWCYYNNNNNTLYFKYLTKANITTNVNSQSIQYIISSQYRRRLIIAPVRESTRARTTTQQSRCTSGPASGHRT